MNKETQISDVERLVGGQAPEGFLEFLRRDRSEMSGKEFVLCHPSGDWIENLENVYGIEKILELLSNNKLNLESGVADFPDKMIPIADNGCGDIILISIDGASSGSIYFLFHEEYDPEQENSGIFKIAENLITWCSALK